MLKIMYNVLRDYGLDSLQLLIISFFGWKLFTNHLKHISDKVVEISKKLNFFGEELNKTKERVAKVEGKIE